MKRHTDINNSPPRSIYSEQNKQWLINFYELFYAGLENNKNVLIIKFKDLVKDEETSLKKYLNFMELKI